MSDESDPIPAPVPFGSGVCPLCGWQEFEWGYLYDYAAEGRHAVFVTRDQAQELFPKWDSEKVHARACKRCGNLQMFVIWDDDQKKKKRG